MGNCPQTGSRSPTDHNFTIAGPAEISKPACEVIQAPTSGFCVEMSLGITRLLKIAYRAFYDFTKQKENKNYLYIIIAGESLPIYSLYRYFIFYFIYYKCRWVYCEKLIPELREIDTQITRD